MATTMKFLQFFCLVLVLHFNYFVAKADDIKFKGDNYTIKCPAPDPKALGVNLYSRRESQREVLYYYFKTDKLTLLKDYEGRVQVKHDNRALTIDILNLQLTDAGTYWCTCNVLRNAECPMAESGVFLVVQDSVGRVSSSTSPNKANGMNDLLIPVTALTAGSVLLLVLLVLGVWLVPKVKKMLRGRKEKEVRSSNGVYEVMTVNRRPGFI